MIISDTTFRDLLALNTRQCDVLKMAAFAAMVMDHLNTASGLNDTLLQAVGRLAFPLFALVWGCNIVRHPVMQASLNRLWLIALLAQPGFWLAFRDTGVQWWQVNILFTFAVMGQAMHFMQVPCNRTAFVSLLALSVYIPVSDASYELRGLLMLLMSALFFLTTGRQQMMVVAGLATSVLLLNAPSGGRNDAVRSAAESDHSDCGLPSCATGRAAPRWQVVCTPLCPASDHHRRRSVPRLILLLLLTPAVQATLTGRVVRVIDGDTVVVLMAPATEVRIRLAGIDAPEKGQPFGQRARQFLASRVTGRTVEISGDNRDRYDRIQGTLWANGQDINAELVCGGMAWAYRVRSEVQNPAYWQCENAAREQKKGLWQAPSPVPPWQWRPGI